MMGERGDNTQHSNSADRSHGEARASLPGYAAAMALGLAPEIDYSVVAAHLQNCSVCRAELAELLDLVLPTYRGEVVPAACNQPIDLSFLGAAVSPVAETRPSWFIDTLHRLVVEFSDALLGSMRQSVYAQAARGAALYHYTPEPPPG